MTRRKQGKAVSGWLILGAMVFDNPYYVEPDEFLALRQ